MALPVANKPFYTYDEYLALDEADKEVRYEYHHGEVFAMSGTTKVHNRIVRNLANLLDDHFLPRGYEVWQEQIKVEAKAKERYYYPDLVVSRSKRDQENTIMVQDPVLIGEVLSDGKCNIELKLASYASIPTLKAFLMVSLHEYLMHLYERRAGKWWYQAVFGKEQPLHLDCFNLSLPVAAVYKNFRLSTRTGQGNEVTEGFAR
ncbi:MAG: hypothetical protein AVDCRST_MAG56-4044 [uncultured Cytophagales bacterium]|uniref:Putative restriction endonuclease domain-containing protein n=1 Tax=uncultured Cytophagales bacterium TaxID=158755 RepID=A0A6J4JQK5_9SPHI|nr:MAG: hypothetical protein AVDCRST_MAG56-4044 [uncultured Cytophagales bacterium]